MRKLISFPLIIGGSLLLSGCASLQLFSFGMSSISYLVSGKSISDHAISKVMAQDCALHRVVTGEEPCNELDGTGVLRAANPNKQSTQITISNQDHWQLTPKQANKIMLPPTNKPYVTKNKLTANISPDETVKQLMLEQQKTKATTQADMMTPAIEQPVKHVNTSTNLKQPLLFAVIGSYNELKYARDSLRKYHQLKAQIITNPSYQHTKGATQYRVVVGPMTEQDFNHNLGDKEKKLNYHAWRLRLCGDSLLPPPCTAPTSAQHAK